MDFTYGAVLTLKVSTFAVVNVKYETISHGSYAAKARKTFAPLFPNLPIVLLAMDNKGRYIFDGPMAEINILKNMNFEDITWKKYIY